ncbi:MAG: protein translocase subunit SecF [Candidatus Taylorbacteria bacterium CG11_big_fil_rev_8_21_14_0_20_46_11]|uniref:Protein-export membrane protein SecF n=1 Tax=Candidatus Taylorbacteria bacterium CG11_big_fil_rev_8_21_14_0_20_46_11 TaxID=1975025 RepID=A0A2H0KCU4_9BACT|nr:MAG: protein translocase subunit SecF [Candidatus Taylorbacteria bacterium CG11_big_fil_rev_8_21_14_0_20_46_11]
MSIISRRKIWYIISGILLVASLGSLLVWGLNLGIDFKGGSIMEVVYTDNTVSVVDIEQVLTPLELGSFSVRPTVDGEHSGFIIRTRELSDSDHVIALTALSFEGTKTAEELRFNSVGPLLGKEAIGKSLWAIVLVLLVIILFIAFAFRKVSEPVRPNGGSVGRVSSWKYGIIAIIALIHDVLIPTGVFSYLGHTQGVEVDTLFVTALLVVLGFSIHDTIVVFDRIREHLRLDKENHGKKPFEEIVGESVDETIGRSINTSLTTLFALLALYFIGPTATQMFALALSIGVIAGTYSSIFIASPLLVTMEKWGSKR